MLDILSRSLMVAREEHDVQIGLREIRPQWVGAYDKDSDSLRDSRGSQRLTGLEDTAVLKLGSQHPLDVCADLSAQT